MLITWLQIKEAKRDRSAAGANCTVPNPRNLEFLSRSRLCVAIIRLLLALNARSVAAPTRPSLKTFPVLCTGIILVADRRIRLTKWIPRTHFGGKANTVPFCLVTQRNAARCRLPSDTKIHSSRCPLNHIRPAEPSSWFRLSPTAIISDCIAAILNAVARIAGVHFRELGDFSTRSHFRANSRRVSLWMF